MLSLAETIAAPTMKTLCLLICIISAVSGYGRGAPKCVDKPPHNQDKYKFQNTTIPFKTKITDLGTNEKKQHMWQVEVYPAKDDTTPSQYSLTPSQRVFKGFLLWPQQSGTWERNKETRKLYKSVRDCKLSNGDADVIGYTQKDPSPRTTLTATFIQEEGSTMKPNFIVIVVVDFSTFWRTEISADNAVQTTTPKTTTSTTTTTTSTTTTTTAVPDYAAAYGGSDYAAYEDGSYSY